MAAVGMCRLKKYVGVDCVGAAESLAGEVRERGKKGDF